MHVTLNISSVHLERCRRRNQNKKKQQVPGSIPDDVAKKKKETGRVVIEVYSGMWHVQAELMTRVFRGFHTDLA